MADNNKSDEIYDVIVVGSGIAGSIMVKTLTQAGKKVLLLEAGLTAGLQGKTNRVFKNYMGYNETYYGETIKTPNSPYPALTNAPSIDVKDLGNATASYLVQEGPLDFLSDCLRAPGGTTMHWLGTTPRMLPNDFKLHSTYGVGVDWPISYEDLMPYYEMAELEIGVSGDVEDQDFNGVDQGDYGANYCFPMKKIPQSHLDTTLMKRLPAGSTLPLGDGEVEVTFASAPQGRNSVPNTDYPHLDIVWNQEGQCLELTGSQYWHLFLGKFMPADIGQKYKPLGANWNPNVGERCEGNSSCVPICPVQAKYNGLKSFRKSDYKNLEIRTQSVATKVLIEDGKVSGIQYKHYKRASETNYTTHTAQAEVYVLAASAIENAKILLASDAANSSDQVGRNLMDHITMLGWGLAKTDKLYPFRGPGSTTNISCLRDGDFRSEHAACILPLDNWGWGWPTFAPGSDVENAVDNLKLCGAKLRGHLENTVTKQLLIHFECEQLPDPDNRVTISDDYLDAIGNHRPVIQWDVTDYNRKGLEAYVNFQTKLFEAMDVEDKTDFDSTGSTVRDHFEYNGNTYKIWGTGHICGTHRMGSSSTDSVVDEDSRCWDHDNLFLVGCGSMPTIGTSNPTLTMTALTFKAAEAILKQLND